MMNDELGVLRKIISFPLNEIFRRFLEPIESFWGFEDIKHERVK
jgi:hypothetical protein